ncbi:hypothetical protein FOZ62_006866 [Perkinsus olseni]|uniref:Glucosamine-6-phosphate deaminase n=1 Tax=Perkinsus olseni TaxID=32597 RepID=A0A7J6U4M4_PEROL|nr:hypothetical protein FOZ62_006866 [Perkinsus olseni]
MMMLNDKINVKVASSSPSVEKALLDKSIYTKDMYSPTEKTRTFIVDSFPLLGKVVAYRFIEWVIGNPEGVCALPTGKTPEYFIKWTQRIVNEWDTPAIKDDRRLYGMDGSIPPPRFDNLWFVMLDEFYPINPEHHNSFKYYVSNYYIKGLGFNPDRCLFIDLSKLGLRPNETLDDIWPDGTFVDLSLRLRTPNTPLEVRQQDMIRQVDQWCLQYESKIRELGGIGFFLGGIGPDGHIAFNVRGSDHRSTTRLAQLNYETQAAASGDLGGIRAVKAKCAVTIGLGTITYNPDCVCRIIAAGEAKASMVADGIQKDTNVM